MGFCGNLSRFLDFTNTVDGGSAVNVETDCACLDVWVIEFSLASVSMLMSSTTHVSVPFLNEAHLHSRCETVIAWFTICVKLIMAFPFTSLPLSFYTSASRQIMVLVLNKKYCWINAFGEKKAQDWQICIPALFNVEFTYRPEQQVAESFILGYILK